MKLRTLKDLQTFYKKGFKLGEIETYETELGKGELIEKRDLKAEAIKWVKELDKEIAEIRINLEAYNEFQKYKEKEGQIPEIYLRAQHQILWIKHFFNITEEDLIELKGGKK